MQVSFSEEQNNNSPKQLSSLRDSCVPSEKDKTPHDEEHKRIDSSTNSITELPIAKKEVSEAGQGQRLRNLKEQALSIINSKRQLRINNN